MDWLHYVIAVLFVILGAGSVALVVIQMPGTWLLLAVALIIELADGLYRSDPEPVTFGWWWLGIALVLAIIGELVEFFASALGAQVGGASRRGVWGSLIGGLVGLIVLTPLFFFVPIFGSLVGAIAGTFIGAVVGEVSGQDKTLRGSLVPATAASVGRVLATVTKSGIAIAIWLVLAVAVFVP